MLEYLAPPGFKLRIPPLAQIKALSMLYNMEISSVHEACIAAEL